MRKRLQQFVARRWSVPLRRVEIDVQPLCGGLESSVALASVAPIADAAVPGKLVVKQLHAGAAHEATAYRLLWTHIDHPPSPAVYGMESEGETQYLYLEHVPSSSAWPWWDTRLCATVCRALARLHDSTALPPAAFVWGYDEQLAESADSTLALAMSALNRVGTRYWRRLGDLKRVVGALPAIRTRLYAPGPTVIHGDVHPGNVIVRHGDSGGDVVLIDWSRSRLGSPLEDVASWLHSVGCWEPEARRRHDTLMRAYLDERRGQPSFRAGLRAQYWLASASNGLAGAIRYHLAVAADPASAEPARLSSRRALAEWERVIRRAAALLTTHGG